MNITVNLKKLKNGVNTPLDKDDKLLIAKTIEGLKTKYTDWTQELNDRMNLELSTIINMGFSSYFLIVADFLDFGRKCGHLKDSDLKTLRERITTMTPDEMMNFVTEKNSVDPQPGMTIGLGRGSGAGSLICYGTGITGLDPIKYGLLFERFLNPERVSMPDIDSDFSKSEFEYGVRDLCIEYVKQKYGENGICGITTPSTLAAKAGIDKISMAKRFQYMQEHPDADEKKLQSHSLNLAKKIKAKIPGNPNTTFLTVLDDERTVIQTLEDEFKDDEEAMDIIRVAQALEGININFGRHACGNIIVENRDVAAYAPLMRDIKTGQMKIQYNAEQAEELGFLKMDFLGLKTLNIITKTVRLIYKNTGKSIDPLAIDFEDENVYKYIFACAMTLSVFQFESNGMKAMLKKFGPTCFADLILLVACFRPGPLQYLDGIIARKHGLPSEENAVTKIAAYYKPFADIVNPTYKALVYQEQIMQTFRMVGYSMGGADNVRRAMGHKKMDVLVAEKQTFVYGDPEKNIAGAIKIGIAENDALQLFEEMIEFAKYSFNKSHAAAYAMTAFITAWLKYYYPAEFYAACIGFLKIEKVPALITEAKSLEVKFHGPDINKSENLAVGNEGVIYLGFSGIKGIGGIDLTGRPFNSIADTVIRSNITDSVMITLVDAGAFDSMCKNRAAIKAALVDVLALRKKRNDNIKKNNIDELMLEDLNNGIPLDRDKYKIKTKSLPTKKKIEDRLEKRKATIKELEDDIRAMVIPVTEISEDLEAKLSVEYDLLGMYVSGHPLDPYGTATDYDLKFISEIEETGKYENATYFGIIKNLVIKNRKKDGAAMAFFDLIDQSGIVPVKCFTSQFEKYGELIKNDKAVFITGSVKAEQVEAVASDEEGADDMLEPEITYELIISGKADKAVRSAGKNKSIYSITAKNGIVEIYELVEALKPFVEDYGHKLMIRDGITNELGYVTFKISDEAKNYLASKGYKITEN